MSCPCRIRDQLFACLVIKLPQCDVHAQPIGATAQETAGKYICMAHDIMTDSPHAIFVTHNDFQGTSPNDTTGLIPVWTGKATSGPLLYLK